MSASVMKRMVKKVAKEYPILVKNTKKSDNTFGKTNEYL